MLAPQMASATGSVLQWTARGAQIYVCGAVDHSFGWRLDGPDATLFDAQGRVQASHGKGPSWRATDDSAITGTIAEILPGSPRDAIPWLVLRITGHSGHGILSNILYVLRSQTNGGLAPRSGCDAQHANDVVRVPYTAIYSFLPTPRDSTR